MGEIPDFWSQVRGAMLSERSCEKARMTKGRAPDIF